ncbi:DgyrCDS3611 [Dimorphilus gyrociliatus]|uniref:DgyrCDS3611 n=1 Tax=Dimorphilus gyrociliatus TaxID=2664684 RepID=A0A7I8VEB1_9ANNE|nr:DgyrCDS3611 [Dimorphilus gyrociliatus]
MATNKRKHEKQGGPSAKKVPPWMEGLKQAMENPDLKVLETDKAVVIKDKYPKARHHYLVLPKENISNLKSCQKEHVELLEHIHEIGANLKTRHENSAFRLGYHAIPSMSQLHMHVISQDMISDCMKTKKHYNSFTTDYFVPSETILKMLKRDGKVDINAKDMKLCLEMNLRCHLCGESQKNIPTLKKHLLLEDSKKNRGK